MDTYNRTIAKTVTYRITTFVLTIAIMFSLTNEVAMSATYGILSLTIGALSFFLHERAWTYLRWGSVNANDSKTRSIVKTITYRLWSLLIVYVISLLFGFTSNEALVVAISLNIMYITIHYLNERIWNKVNWGK